MNFHYYNCLLAVVLPIMLSACSHHDAHHHHAHHDVAEASFADTHHHHHHPNEILFTHHQAEAAGLRLDTVRPVAFAHMLKVSGQLRSAQTDEYSVVATSSGLVTFADGKTWTAGQTVQLGETLFRISASAMLQGDPMVQVEAEYEAARADYERQRSLLADRLITRVAFEEAERRYKLAAAAYRAAHQPAVRTSQSGSGVLVKASSRGYIKHCWVAPGEYVETGDILATIIVPRRMMLQADVPMQYAGLLPTIATASFTLPSGQTVYRLQELGGQRLSAGMVAETGAGNLPPVASPYVPLFFEFNYDARLVVGSYVDIYLHGVQSDNRIVIPKSALTEEQGMYFVYRRIGHEHFLRQEVQLGMASADSVEVLSGLHVGEQIVTHGAYQVKLAASSSIIPEGHHHHH